MRSDTRQIVVDNNISVTSVWAVPEHYDRNLALVMAHGAGNDMHNPLLSYLHRAIADNGALCVKFNFPYKEQGRRAPDPAPRLMLTWRAVVKEVISDSVLAPRKLILSGKSLGGRMASMVAAEDGCADGLVFFGYPLHPPGQTDKLRTAHLEKIVCPMLFIQGTRDPLCDLALFERFVRIPLADRIVLHTVEGGDHSFRVPKRADRSVESVWQEIAAATIAWAGSRFMHSA